MGRSPCCSGDHSSMKKGPWSCEEDVKLKSFLLNHPTTSWRLVPSKAGLVRCGKSCRLRWMNYLRPDIRRGNFAQEELDLIIQLHQAIGNKWSIIVSHLPGRTDNEIKNLWNTKLRKALVLKGINPITHQPFYKSSQLTDYINWINTIDSAVQAGLAAPASLLPVRATFTGSNGSSSSKSCRVTSGNSLSYNLSDAPCSTTTALPSTTTAQGLELPLVSPPLPAPMADAMFVQEINSQGSGNSLHRIGCVPWEDVPLRNYELDWEFGNDVNDGHSTKGPLISEDVNRVSGLTAAQGFGLWD